MIIVAGHIRLDPARRDQAVEAATEMMAETAKEDGCIVYVFSASFGDPGLFHVYEEWETLEHLADHGKAPHMAVFQAKMADFGVSERSINRYTVTDQAAL